VALGAKARRRVRASARRIWWGPTPEEVAAKVLRRQIADGDVEWGNRSYGTPTVTIFDAAGAGRPYLKIGAYCSMARGVTFVVNGEHWVDWTTTYPLRRWSGSDQGLPTHPKRTGPIDVGSDVWIGTHALILGGVTIGDGAVVAAGSIVTKDVRPYAVVGGIPARELRDRRFSDDIVDELLALRWWDYPAEAVNAATDELSAPPDVEAIRKALGVPHELTN